MGRISQEEVGLGAKTSVILECLVQRPREDEILAENLLKREAPVDQVGSLITKAWQIGADCE
jgi:hypothetical protein